MCKTFVMEKILQIQKKLFWCKFDKKEKRFVNKDKSNKKVKSINQSDKNEVDKDKINKNKANR